MNTDKKYAINLKILKIFGFYQLVDPDGTKMYGYNIYKIVHITLVAITTMITGLGLSGFTYKTNYSSLDDIFRTMQMIFYIACITVGNIKMMIIVCNVDKLWNVLNIAQETFFSNKYCRENYFKLVKHRNRFSFIFALYFFIFIMTGVSWCIVPIVVLNDHRVENNTKPLTNKINIINLKYPIPVNTYNEFYNTIYVIESIMVIYSAYGLALFDIFLFAILQLISAYYEIISSAYEHVQFASRRKYGESIFSILLSIT